MKRYLQIWLAQARYSIIRDMAFKGTFLLWIVVEMCWFGVQLCFIKVLYLNTESIAGWTQWEMVLLVATSQLIIEVFYTLFIVNMLNFSELVRTGKLDFFLALPAPPQFLVSTRVFDVVSLLNAIPAIGLMIYAAMRATIHLSILNFLIYFVLIFAGVMVHYSIALFFASLVFWLKQGQRVINSYFQIFPISRLPKEVFHGFFRFLFTWIFPFLLMATVPAKTLLHGFAWKETAILVGLTTLLFFASSAFFNFGLKRYGSASS